MFEWLFGRKEAPAPPPTPVLVQRRPRPFMSDEAVARLAAAKPKPLTAEMFAPARPPKGVLPDGESTIAMDWSPDLSTPWTEESSYGLSPFGAAIPMQTLAIWAQRPEYRKISDVYATEMTRRWIKIGAVEDEAGKSERIDGINAALVRFRVRDAFRDAIRNDGLMGRGHVYIDLGTSGSELATSIGNGADAATKQKVTKGSLKGIRSAEPMWIYPQGYNARNPLAVDFYNPQLWYVMGEPVHSTRLLTIVAREVPDILKPAYAFGGLSLTQMVQPYVDRWLRTSESVSDIVNAFSVFVLSTDMDSILQGGGGGGDMFGGGGTASGSLGILGRLDLFNRTRDNRGVFAINKATEEFQNISANLGTLDKLQAQAFEYVVAMSGQTMTKYSGIQPSGLNATGEGEAKSFADNIHAAQEGHLRDPLQTIIDMIQLNEFGNIDPTIRFTFEPLLTMSEKETAELEKLNAETDNIRIDGGVLWNHEVRQTLADDPDGRYAGLNVDDLPDLSTEEAEGLVVKGEQAEDALNRLFPVLKGA